MACCKTWHLTSLLVPFDLLLIRSPGFSQDAGTADRKATRGLPRHPAARAAARDSTQIWARRALRPDDGLQVTSFRLVTGGDCREVELRGTWSLHDAHPEGLLLKTSDPIRP